MLSTEPIHLDIFVGKTLLDKECQKITDAWPLKTEVIQSVVIKHFQEMGIYRVCPVNQADQIRKEIIFYLKHSPTLIEMVDKARRIAAQNAARNRGNTAN